MAEAQPSQLLCGLLFLLSEVLKALPELGNLRNFLKEEAGGVQQKFKDEDDDDDDEEHYEDVKEEEDADEKEAQNLEKPKVKKENALVAPGWNFKGAATSAHSERNCYDPTARNPLYCGAGRTALWELERLANHFHPSGKLFDTSTELNFFRNDPSNC